LIEDYVDEYLDEPGHISGAAISEEEDEHTGSPLDPFLASGHISEVLHAVKSGKEGTVYCCRADSSTGPALIAAKVYRSREHRSFKNDSLYRQGRVILNGHDARAVKKKTGFGREAAFAMWVEHEYGTLRSLYQIGANVPRPITRSSNVILMDFLGDEEQAAPHLQSVKLEPDEVRPLYEKIVGNVELLLSNNLIHGDLSSYNILYWKGAVTIIDVPQAVDPRFNPDAYTLLQRDLQNVCAYFARYGVKSDPDRMTNYLWSRFVRSEL
jgi:RIO kinase 1